SGPCRRGKRQNAPEKPLNQACGHDVVKPQHEKNLRRGFLLSRPQTLRSNERATSLTRISLTDVSADCVALCFKPGDIARHQCPLCHGITGASTPPRACIQNGDSLRPP